MKKWLKRILAGIAVVLVLLVLVVLVLPFVIDPNSFKAPLQRLAAGQNVDLRLEGPLDWQFYPRLGLSLEEVVVAPLSRPDQPLVAADSATAAVALMPLFFGEVLVDELILQGPEFTLTVDEDGRGNWERLGSGETDRAGEDEEPGSGEADQFALAVERIDVGNGALSFENRQTGQTAQLRDVTIQLADVNLDSRPFPLTIEALVAGSDLPRTVRLRLESQLQASSGLDRFATQNGRLHLAVEGETGAEISSRFSGEAELEPELAYRGELTIEAFDLKAVLGALGQPFPTTDPAALSSVGLELKVSGSGSQLSSQKLQVTLDDTAFNGNVALEFPENRPLSAKLEIAGNRIDVDRYLPPTEDNGGDESGSPAPAPAPDSEPSEDTPLPVEALRMVDLDLKAYMDTIVAMDMPLTNASLAVMGENGLWRLTDLQADFYEGQLQGSGELDAGRDLGGSASGQLAMTMEGLSVQPLLMDFAEFQDLSGTLSGELRAETRAATTGELMDNLSAAFVFTSPELTFQGINAEYYYCQMATQLGDGEMPDTQWPPRTRITQVEGQLTFDESRLSIASFAAYVENLVLTATGYLDLEEMLYRVRVPMRLAQEQTSPSGCLIESNFLRERAVDVLGCAGSLTEADFGEQCGLDKDAVADLAKEAVRYNVEKRVDEEKQEIRDKLKEKLQPREGEEDDPARSLLRDLLN